MKKLFAFCLVCVLALGVTACGAPAGSTSDAAPPNSSSQPASAPTAPAEEGKVTYTSTKPRTKKIGMVIPASDNEFYVSVANKVKAVVEAAGYTFAFEGVNGEATRGINAIENYITSDVDAIIIMAQDKSCDAALKKAMDAGILVVSASAEVQYYDHWLAQDNYDVGYKVAEMAAEWVNKVHGGKCKIVAFGNNANPAVADKTKGMLEGLKELLPNSEQVGFTEGLAIGSSQSAMENFLLKDPDIKCIVGMHDAFPLEAIEAVKAAGKAADDFGAFGASASSAGVSLLKDGKSIFRGTIWMGDQGKTMAEHTLGLLNGETYDKIYYAENIIITPENVSDYDLT